MSYSVAQEDFSQLEKAWEDLLGRYPQGSVFLAPRWQQAWWREIGQSGQLYLLSIYNENSLAGLAPLMRRGEELSLLGSKDVCDYRDIVVAQGEEKAAFAILLDYLQSQPWRRLRLESVPATSATYATFLPLARSRGYRVETTKEDVCPQMELPATWEDYLAGLEAKARHELRRKLRRLEQAGARHSCFLPEAATLAADLEDFFRLMRLSRQPEKAEFLTLERERFFRTICHDLQEPGYLRLCFLEIGSQRVAAALAFDYGSVRYLYNSGYDPAYAYWSVSLLLKAYCIQDAIAQGLRRFDFLRGDEAYKYDLGGRDLEIWEATITRPD